MRRPLLNMAKLPSQRAGFAVGRWVLLGPSQVSTCKVVLPARSRAGIQAFSKRKPGRKESRGRSPAPPFLGPARSRSLVLAWWGAAGRLWGYYGAHLRALIWMRILREQGLGEKAFRCGGVPPTKASPWGEAVTGGDG